MACITQYDKTPQVENGGFSSVLFDQSPAHGFLVDSALALMLSQPQESVKSQAQPLLTL